MIPAAVLAVLAASARPVALAESPQAVVRGHLGRALDEYTLRLEALGFSGGLAVVKAGETVLLKGYCCASWTRA